jgi:hypothetical protein
MIGYNNLLKIVFNNMDPVDNELALYYQEERKAKQNFLISEVANKGYDTADFA